jgi:anaerobic magnesium-protoporphyrin IX monomethyl ester cyclase
MIRDRDLDLWWWCLSTQNTLINNEQMIQTMAQAGAKTIYVGIESAASKTLKEFNKDMEKDRSYDTIRLLKKNGIQVFASYIIGGLSDDVRSIINTIKLARSLDTEVAQFTILTPYPGTAIYTQLKHRLRHKKWHLYDGVHLVFKHDTIPYLLMELLLLCAYGSFYARGLKAVKGFVKAFINNSPFFKNRKKK